MTNIKGHRNDQLHDEDGSHRDVPRSSHSRTLAAWDRWKTEHMAAHAAEARLPAPVQFTSPVEASEPAQAPAKKKAATRKAPANGETVDAEKVYVWLTKEESTAGKKLPARIKAADMWLSVSKAYSSEAKDQRAEDARWLIIANGTTRVIMQGAFDE